MDFSFTPDQEALRDQILEFATRELTEGAIERDRGGVFPHDLWEKCGEMGLQGLPVPESHGGVGLDSLSTAIALEAFGYGCRDGGLAFAIGAHLLACVIPVWRHGSEELKERYLPGLSNGSLIAVNAITEPDSGSDAFAMKTRAVSVEGGFRIDGTKTFASNGPVADLAVVYAATDPDRGFLGGITAFLVEKGTPGFSVGQKFEKMGLRTAPLSELVFDDVFVPDDSVIGGVGGGGPIFNHSMEWERICLPAIHLGTMRHLLDRAVEQARTRKAFGQSIGKNQAISHRIADLKVRLEAARLLTYRSAERLETAGTVGLDASMTKLLVSESLVRSALDVVQIFGGYGYMDEYEVERILRDSIGSTIYSGTSEMQRNIIAGWLGL
ncbi:MAG: acyl-CoA dehydrogenase family protein [Gemmatimonadota bacterium]|nr:acyl-CoA dehydrogenase family protein [Gemmatimonadota bacterium]